MFDACEYDACIVMRIFCFV